MGKRGSWFSTLKRVFTPHSKEKLVSETEKKAVKEKKKWGLGRLRHGENHSFIPLGREPSSIEKILGDAEREQHQRTHGLVSRDVEKPSHSLQPREKQHIQPLALPSTVQQQQTVPIHQPSAAPNYHQNAAIKIQTAYRGYMARRSFRALKGLVRLQGLVRGPNVKRQTVNAIKFMQLQVRVQQQIHSRRLQMVQNQARQRHILGKMDKELESSLGKGTATLFSEAEHQEWDDSLLTKKEVDARMQRKVEAVIKRERALAYAYSHQLWKSTPKTAQAALMEIRSGGFPWWWHWLERQLPGYAQEDVQSTRPMNSTVAPKHDAAIKTESQSNGLKQPKPGLGTSEVATPRSTKSLATPKDKHLPSPMSRAPQMDSPKPFKQMRTRLRGDELSMATTPRDDESLTSCPPFAVPNYMVPTVSAKAKVRACSTPRERSAAVTPKHDSTKRLSFPLSQGIGSLTWNKTSIFSGKESNSQRMLRNSIGDLSVDSTLSLPVGVGRRPFK